MLSYKNNSNPMRKTSRRRIRKSFAVMECFFTWFLRLCGEEEVMMKTSHFRWSSSTIIKYSVNFGTEHPKRVTSWIPRESGFGVQEEAEEEVLVWKLLFCDRKLQFGYFLMVW